MKTRGNSSVVNITGGTAKFDDGAVGTPSVSFTLDPDTGLYKSSASSLDVAVDGVRQAAFQANRLFLLSNTAQILFGSGQDITISKGGTGILLLAGGNSGEPMETRHAAGSGAYASIITATELLTIAAAATTDSVLSIPAGAILLMAAVRVTTVIPTAATFTVTTTTGGTTLSTAAVSVAATSTDKGTAAGASYRAAATTIRITPNLTPATATGVVRISVAYINPSAPTS